MLVHKTAKPINHPKPKPPLLEGLTNGLIVKSCFAGLDMVKIKDVMERSFGKHLKPGYFDESVKLVIVDNDYKGIAVVKEIDGIPYLDKFAVAPEYQSNGVGKRIWAQLKEECPSVIWRASETNPINGWYQLKSDGSQKSGKWIVFWCGSATAELIGKVACREESFLVQ